MGLRGEEHIGGDRQRGQARPAAHRARGGRGQQSGDLAQLGAGVTDGGGDSVDALHGSGGRRSQF